MQSGRFADWPDSGPVRIVRIEQDVDIASRGAFEAALASATDLRPLIVDLSYCPFLDSTGLSALVKRRSSGPPLAIVLPKKCQVERVFLVTKMDSILDIYETVTEATAALSRPIG